MNSFAYSTEHIYHTNSQFFYKQPGVIHRYTGYLPINILHDMLSSFCRIFGANDQTIFPPIDCMKESRLYKILHKESAPEQVEILYQKGLLEREVRYFTPSQLGGKVGGKASAKTDEGCESGQHLNKEDILTMSMMDRGKASTKTDEGCELGQHLNKEGMLTMSMMDRSKLSAASQVGYSRGGHFSIIKVDARTTEPLEAEQSLYATSKSSLAAFLVNSGTCKSFEAAKKQMTQHYKDLESKREQTPTVDTSIIIRLVNSDIVGGATFFRLTKHVEKPLNMNEIPKEILINEGAEFRKRNKEDAKNARVKRRKNNPSR
jgi:hypothetical protein